MKPILKNFYSTYIEVPLSDYTPSSPSVFGLLARLIVGEQEMEGEESFDIMICTPQWLLSNYNSSDIIYVRQHLIVFEYNYQRIYTKIQSLIEGCEGENWDEIGLKIG